MDESCTLYQAIALLAYRDEDVARRYGAKPGIPESGRDQRKRDTLYPTNSNLPGTETFKGAKDERVHRALVQRWEEQDNANWSVARGQLWSAVQADDVSTFDRNGKVEQDFWLTHNLDNPEVQHFRFRRSDLMRLLRRSEIGAGAWTSAAELFEALEVRGTADAIHQVTPLLRSGDLIAWLGNDADAATAWRPIETRLFKLGLTIHRAGSLTKGNVPTVAYAALTDVSTGPVWFRSQDLQRVGLMGVADTSWRSSKNLRHLAWLTRFREGQRVVRRWVCAFDLADWYSKQRGAVTTAEAEALHDEACQQLFRSLLTGDFVDLQSKPHLTTKAGVSRILPEQAEWFRGQHWAGQRDRLREPILSNDLLHELLRDVWLPAHLIADWCKVRNLALPSWLPRPQTAAEKADPRMYSKASQAHAIAGAPPPMPAWLSPMEAIAWIVSRHPQIVGYANPERNVTRVFFIKHTLPNGKQVCGTDSLPPGMTLGWLDAFAACDVDAPLPAEQAMSELLDALRKGRVIARAIWSATGERRDMGSDEWHGLTLDSPPRNERVLLPCRLVTGMPAKQPETRWKDVLFPTSRLLELWPGHDGTITAALPPTVRREHDLEGTKRTKPPIAPAELAHWYQARRDAWPDDRKHPSEAEDLTDARDCYPDHHITREAVRTVRARLAPVTWTSQGRRKHAQK